MSDGLELEGSAQILTNVTKPMNAIAMLLVQIILDLMIVNAGLGLGAMEEVHVVILMNALNVAITATSEPHVQIILEVLLANATVDGVEMEHIAQI